MLLSVNLSNVKKGSIVVLKRDLPLNNDLGNTHHIVAVSHYGQQRSGHVTSNGFEAGMLNVQFDLYPEGTQRVRFNELSAANYLLIDIY
jgi:hypothetical protein